MRYNVLVEESFQNARQGKVQILDSYAPSPAPQSLEHLMSTGKSLTESYTPRIVHSDAQGKVYWVSPKNKWATMSLPQTKGAHGCAIVLFHTLCSPSSSSVPNVMCLPRVRSRPRTASLALLLRPAVPAWHAVQTACNLEDSSPAIPCKGPHSGRFCGLFLPRFCLVTVGRRPAWGCHLSSEVHVMISSAHYPIVLLSLVTWWSGHTSTAKMCHHKLMRNPWDDTSWT